MTRDIKEEVLGTDQGQMICFGTQYDHIKDKWYIFHVHNGDYCRPGTTIFRTLEQASDYAEKMKGA